MLANFVEDKHLNKVRSMGKINLSLCLLRGVASSGESGVMLKNSPALGRNINLWSWYLCGLLIALWTL